MTNIAVHREQGRGAIQSPMKDWFSPLRAWRDLVRWDPFAEMAPLISEEERALFAPDFDVKETKNEFVFRADLPGMDAKDVEVKITDNRLSVEGKREQEREEKGDTFYRRERSYGSFCRSFTMPIGADLSGVNADLKNGVLTITVNKKPEAKPKSVTVKSS